MARSERALTRTRRRYRAAAAGLIASLVGLATIEARSFQRGGWVGVLPAWTLALWAPASRPLSSASFPTPIAARTGPTSSRIPLGAVAVGPGGTFSGVTAGGPPGGSVTFDSNGPSSVTAGGSLQMDAARNFLITPGGSYTINGRTTTVPNGQAATITFGGKVTMSPWPPRQPTDLRLYREMWARLQAGTAWEWEASLYMRRVIASDPSLRPRTYLRFPARWPVSEPLPVLVDSSTSPYTIELRLPGGPWAAPFASRTGNASREMVTLANPGSLTGPAVEARFRLAGKTIYTETFPLPTDLRPGFADVLDRLDSAETNDLVRGALRPRVLSTGRGAALVFHDRDDSEAWHAINFAVFFTVELRQNGRALAQGSGCADWLRPVWKREERVVLDFTEGALAEGPVEVVLRGDPDAAARFYASRPFEPPSSGCWGGELTWTVAPTPEP